VVAGGLPLVRATRCNLLEGPALQVVASTANAASAVEAAERCAASFALVDADIDGGCVPAVRKLVDRVPGISVLVIAPRLEPRVLLAVVRAGANGVVTEAAGAPGFLRSVAAALRGEAVVPREGVAAVIDQVRALAGRRIPTAEAELGLTRRVSEVASLLRDGLTPKQIALELQVSAVTVRRHRAESRKAAAARQARPTAKALEPMS
jgi:DNA-binding NarL/FixJ family response regulator